MKHLPDCEWVSDSQGCRCADRIFWETASPEEREEIKRLQRTVPEWAGRRLW